MRMVRLGERYAVTGKLVSVIMPVYNAEKYLAEAVDSVLSQTYRNLELIIIDDCSSDNSLEIARLYTKSDDRVRVIAGEKNQGVARVRNCGIQEARGEYIALLDSDDVWCKEKLERQVKLIESKGAQIAYCSYDFMDENGISVLKPFIVPEQTNYRKMLISNAIGCSTAFVDANLMRKHPFNPECYHEDYGLWMELLKIPVKAVGDREVLMHYRLVKGSRSSNKWNAAKNRWKIYRNDLNLNIAQSCIAFVGYSIWGVVKHYL